MINDICNRFFGGKNYFLRKFFISFLEVPHYIYMYICVSVCVCVYTDKQYICIYPFLHKRFEFTVFLLLNWLKYQEPSLLYYLFIVEEGIYTVVENTHL